MIEDFCFLSIIHQWQWQCVNDKIRTDVGFYMGILHSSFKDPHNPKWGKYVVLYPTICSLMKKVFRPWVYPGFRSWVSEHCCCLFSKFIISMLHHHFYVGWPDKCCLITNVIGGLLWLQIITIWHIESASYYSQCFDYWFSFSVIKSDGLNNHMSYTCCFICVSCIYLTDNMYCC